MGRLTHQLTNEDPPRLSRVLDAKYRCIGIDVDTLKQQASERRAGEEAEKQLDLEWARITCSYDRQLRLADQNADTKKTEALRDEHAFRNEHQLKHTRNEWDLNRPDAKRLDRPAREGDDDERCGVSSMQRFTGEDLSAASRKAEQVEQCDRWWAHQSAELQAARDNLQCEKQQLGDLTRFYDSVQQAVMSDEQQAARADKADLMNRNSDLAAARKKDREEELAKQRALNQYEIMCALKNPVLCEDPAQARSWMSDGRVRKDHWKGMTPEEKKSILDTQTAQVEESKRRRQCERARDTEWARMALQTDKAIKEQQRQADLFKKQQALDRKAFLRAQEQEKAARDKKMNDVYANAVTGAYFSQWGTSHR